MLPQMSLYFFQFIFSLLIFRFIFLAKSFILRTPSSSPPSTKLVPKSYPLVGHFFAMYPNQHRRTQFTAEVLRSSPSFTFVFRGLFGSRKIMTANPAVVQHILKTNFPIYQKGDAFRVPLSDLLGDGIFNAEGDSWKFQRQVSVHEFTTKSLRNFVESVVDIELTDRLLPILSLSAIDKSILDFQDILQRFAFDNICKIAFGYDPACLLPSLPYSKFAAAFDDAVKISAQRTVSLVSPIWKMKKFFGIGSEKQLANANSVVRDFATNIITEKKKELQLHDDEKRSMIESFDLLSRFIMSSSGHSDEKFLTDIVISFIVAGRDTTSAALTWFFWLVSNNPLAYNEILKEINETHSNSSAYKQVKDMVYTHAALCEAMRLYPPVPLDSKVAAMDDVLPEGTVVKKGDMVGYHPYAMGRLESRWGRDWAEYKPERWLGRDHVTNKWRFVANKVDPYTYPVFQAGPRICLGMEMAFLQMKMVVAGVMRRFRVVPVIAEGVEPVFVTYLTSKMKGGFPVRIEEMNCGTG